MTLNDSCHKHALNFLHIHNICHVMIMKVCTPLDYEGMHTPSSIVLSHDKVVFKSLKGWFPSLIGLIINGLVYPIFMSMYSRLF